MDLRNETEGAENIIFEVVRVQITRLVTSSRRELRFQFIHMNAGSLICTSESFNDTRAIEDRANVYDIDKL